MDSDIEIIDCSTISKKLKNIQLYPSRIRIEINDKAVKKLFGFSSETYNQLRNGTPFNIVETLNHPKHGKITTPYSFVCPYEDPFNEFDRAVLSVCTGEYIAGNQYTTVSIIFRALIGKVGYGDINPSKNQKAAILHSISKLLAAIIKCDTTQSFPLLHYDYAQIVESSFLPCCRAEVTINGQVNDIIFFDRISPFFDVADSKNQILRYPSELLNIPNQNNTPLIISIKNYVLRRIIEIISHKMTATITFDDILQRFNLDKAYTVIQKRVRETVIELFQHLQNKNFIESFDIKKKPSGNGFYGISFTYKKSDTEPFLQ